MNISATIRRYLFLVLLAGIPACLLYVLFHSSEPSQPQYQAKTLTDWAKEIDPGDFFRPPGHREDPEKFERAVTAIQHIGTNALPVALDLLAAKDSWLKRKLEERAERYNDNYWPKQFPIQIVADWEKNYEGANIIWALGPMAKPVIPDLIQLLRSRNREIAANVMFALPGVGTNAIPPLLELLSRPSPEVRLRAALVLADFFRPQLPATPGGPLVVTGSDDFRSAARAAVPVLLQCLDRRDINLVTRIRAIHALGLIHEDASVVMPVFIRHLHSESNLLLFSDYCLALKNFGTNASSAIPILLEIVKSHHYPSHPALMALRRIDPEAAKPFVEAWQASLTNSPSIKGAGSRNKSTDKTFGKAASPKPIR